MWDGVNLQDLEVGKEYGGAFTGGRGKVTSLQRCGDELVVNDGLWRINWSYVLAWR